MKTDIRLQELRETKKVLETTLTTDMKMDLGPHELRETKVLEMTLTTDMKTGMKSQELSRRKSWRRH